ncbi:MAG: hypothetical protein CL484_13465 [Acidobacteria bacterium]|nr:hypothetical protein [Acidobacteriota bacterium]|tara:strand:+ start:106 stop:1419 length:1314 start_codon:yes stop_codon:yes gene_type:complete
MNRPPPIDPLDELARLERFGIKPGLATIRCLTEALNRPQTAYQSIIVAGSNGKGSVVAMVDQALRSAGYRVGRYTSPHLTSLTERFVVDGKQIQYRELKTGAQQLFSKVDRLLREGSLSQPPTFFEATTAIALSWFRKTRVDLALLEVGLGGRFDATNIVTPVAGVITPIALEHCQYLGTTIEAIAHEKAGIIKPGMIVVTTETTPKVIEIFKQACSKNGARLVQANIGTSVSRTSPNDPQVIKVTTPSHTYPPFKMNLAGSHQISNGIGAIRLLEELADIGIPVSTNAVANGLSTAVWPGRLEWMHVEGRGKVLLDAAHNPAAASALAEYLGGNFPKGLPLVLAVMNDKDLNGVVKHLAPFATHFICTKPDNPRAIPADALARQIREIPGTTSVTSCQDPKQALETAWNHSQTVCATGSIFLVGEILTNFSTNRSG